MAESTYENVKLMTNTKGEGLTHISVPTQSSHEDFTSEWRSPRVTITRNYTVTGNGKIQFKAESSDGEQKINRYHEYNNYKTMAEEIKTDTVRGWRSSFSCNPENEAEVVQILYAVQRGYSDRRAPRDMEEYGNRTDYRNHRGEPAVDYYGMDRAKYYHAYCEWRDAGYPVEVTVLDANSTSKNPIILEQYTMTIADAKELLPETEEEVVVVKREEFVCECGKTFRSRSGRWNCRKRCQK